MTRALVLGGGGPVGIAWESGLLNGLADGGVDASNADFIMGTSAGSFVGARLAMGHDPRGFAAPFMESAMSQHPRIFIPLWIRFVAAAMSTRCIKPSRVGAAPA